MISIRPSIVPEYLKISAFFTNLGEDDEEVSVPQDCCKMDTSVTNAADLDELLRTLRFWGMDQIPITVVRFLITNDREVWEPVVAIYVTDLPMVAQVGNVLQTKREQQVCEAAFIHNVDIVSCLLEHGYPSEYKLNSDSFWTTIKRAVDIAAGNGDLDILKALRLHNCPFHESTARAAARGGHFECLEYLIQNGCPVVENLVNYAFASGSVECLRYVHETIGCSWTADLFCELNFPIIDSPHSEAKLLQCLEYALAHGCPHDPDACSICGQLGFSLLLQHLHEHGSPWGKPVVHSAAYRGHLSCLKYAMEHDCPVPDNLFCIAMLSGSVDIIQYLFDRGLTWPERPLFLLYIEYIPTMGNVSVSLAHAYSLGCPRDPNTCYYASMYGWLDILKDGYQHGCAVDVVCTREAAGHGRLECLKYLHEIGCPWDEDTAAGALISEHYDCLGYLIQHGCPVSQVTMRKYNAYLQSAK